MDSWWILANWSTQNRSFLEGGGVGGEGCWNAGIPVVFFAFLFSQWDLWRCASVWGFLALAALTTGRVQPGRTEKWDCLHRVKRACLSALIKNGFIQHVLHTLTDTNTQRSHTHTQKYTCVHVYSESTGGHKKTETEQTTWPTKYITDHYVNLFPLLISKASDEDLFKNTTQMLGLPNPYCL